MNFRIVVRANNITKEPMTVASIAVNTALISQAFEGFAGKWLRLVNTLAATRLSGKNAG